MPEVPSTSSRVQSRPEPAQDARRHRRQSLQSVACHGGEAPLRSPLEEASMSISSPWKWGRLAAFALTGWLTLAMLGPGEPCGCLNLDDLQRMSGCQLRPYSPTPSSGGRSRDVCRDDWCTLPTGLPRVKTRLANAVWRQQGRHGRGPLRQPLDRRHPDDRLPLRDRSQLDGRPAGDHHGVLPRHRPVLEHARRTREVAPGLYMGPVTTLPCPKFRGYVALQLEPCKDCSRACR